MRASSPPPPSHSGFEPKHASPYSILYEGQDTGTHIPAQKIDPRTLKAVLANHAENEEDIKESYSIVNRTKKSKYCFLSALI